MLALLGTLGAGVVTLLTAVLLARLTGQWGALRRIERMSEVAAGLTDPAARRTLESQASKEATRYVKSREGRIPPSVVLGSGLFVLVWAIFILAGMTLISEPVGLNSFVFVRVAEAMRVRYPALSWGQALYVTTLTTAAALIIFLSFWALSVYALRSLGRRLQRWAELEATSNRLQAFDLRHPIQPWMLTLARWVGIAFQIFFAGLPIIFLIWWILGT